MDPVAQSELVSVLTGINELTLEIVKAMKASNTVVGQIEALFEDIKNNADLQAKMASAFAAVKNLPADAKQIDLSASLTLASLEISYLPQLVAAL